MSADNYIGITIGPIMDTLTSVSSPAGLWGVSYMFSYISRQICEKLLKKGIEKENFITPVFDLEENKIKKEVDGVGLFPDRIIFRAPAGFEDKNLKDLKDLIESVKKSLGTSLSQSINMNNYEKKIIEFVNAYIQIHYVVLSEAEGNKDQKNCVLNISPYLDSIELNKTFPKNQTENYFLNLFEGDSEEERNSRIKRSFLMTDANDSQILKVLNEGNNEKKIKIKTINEIACKDYSEENKPVLKKHGYYAVVQADGDNIGKVLRTFTDDEEVKGFSKKCLTYVTESSKIIEEYEGVTLYAGGDDLLFLCPVENSKKKTIFDVCKKLSCKFNETFKDEIDTMKKRKAEGDEEAKLPSVSFGISIHHTKYPLYEALMEAQNLLFGVAKNTKNKNCMALELTKSSGQKLGLVIPNNESGEDTEVPNDENFEPILDCFLKVLDTFLGVNQEIGEKDKVLHSVIYKTALFESLLTIAAKEEGVKIENLFNNIFDSEIHLENTFIKVIGELYKRICENDQGIEISGNKGIDHRKKEVVVLEYLLRLAKFFTEKAGERE